MNFVHINFLTENLAKAVTFLVINSTSMTILEPSLYLGSIVIKEAKQSCCCDKCFVEGILKGAQ